MVYQDIPLVNKKGLNKNVSLQHFHKDLQPKFFLIKPNLSAREAKYFLVRILNLVYFITSRQMRMNVS